MKKLTLITLLSLVAATSQASLLSEKFKEEVRLETRNQVNDALNTYLYYSQHDQIGGAYQMRGKALNQLKTALAELDKEAKKDSYSKVLVQYFGGELTQAKVTLKNAIQIHNSLGKGTTSEDLKATTAAFTSMKKSLNE